MTSSRFLMLLGGLLVLAFVAEEAFRWLRIPPALVLMGFGLARSGTPPEPAAS